MRYIFYDKRGKRWQKLLRILRTVFICSAILSIFVLFSVYHVPTLGIPQRLDIYELSKTIARIEPDKISVSGNGAIAELSAVNEKQVLARNRSVGKKEVVLTFDDGPDPITTPKILAILREHNVKAVFFVIGEQAFKYPEIMKQIVGEGHTLGVHTFTHSDEHDEASRLESAGLEIDFPQKILLSQTGNKHYLFRAPFWGAEDTITEDNLRLILQAIDRGYIVLSNTLDSQDWHEKDSKKIIENSVDLDGGQVILFHDGGGDRSVTLESLPEIIKMYKGAGFSFVSFENTIHEATLGELLLARTATSSFWLIQNFWVIVGFLFKASLGILATDIFLNLILASIQIVKSRRFKGGYVGKVSVLIPAYNEEKTLRGTINSILASNYINFEIIIINNNSTDATVAIAESFRSHSNIKLINEPRQGKHFALNSGISKSKGEVVVVVDADTQVLPSTISNLVKYFCDKKIGAVAGNMKVGNIKNLLTASQAVEYVVGLNLERRAYQTAGAILVVPGALGAWRKQVLVKAGGFKGDTLTEDADITIKVQKLGFKVVYAENAVAFTEVPESLTAFTKQRLRWSFGILQVIFKHHEAIFKPKYGRLGMLVFPFIVFVRLPIMMAGPLVEVLGIIYLIYNPVLTLTYFSVFMVLTTVLVFITFLIGGEKRLWLLATLPINRIYYTALGHFVFYKSVFAILKGVRLPWTKMTRIGSVNLATTKV